MTAEFETHQVQSVFHESLQDRLTKLLTHSSATLLKDHLIKAAEQTENDISGVIAKLCRSPQISNGIVLLTDATAECLATLNNAREAKKIWEKAVEILGWIILLSIKSDWIDKSQQDILNKAKMFKLEIPIGSAFGVEIVLSRCREKAAKFALGVKTVWLQGEHAADGGALVPESGFRSCDHVNDIKRAIWQTVFPEESVPGEIGASEEKLLNARLRLDQRFASKHLKKNYYITVNLSDTLNPLSDNTILSQVQKALPNLLAVFIGKKQDEVFVLPEEDLNIMVRTFLELKP